ncbi:MAG TPA: PEGA domain-containing protein [Polyangiaceae bacterium]|nr:PEGA domain-containing protein [Polyangiaceae bacterium]
MNKLAVALLLGAALASSLPAVAQTPAEEGVPPPAAAPPEIKPLAETLSGEAHDAYESAKLLLQNHDALGAIAKFQRAYALSSDARLLWNIAVCEKELRHYAAASRLVTRYLNEGGALLSEESRNNAAATDRALRAFYSEVTLEGAPSGAHVSVDGQALGDAPLAAPLAVDLGERQLTVELEGYEPFSRRLQVPGVTPITVQVALTRRKQTATLGILTGQADAVISLDGKVVASDHFQASLPAGRHAVRVTAQHKQTYETSVELAPGSSRTLQIALRDVARPIWPWVAGGAALLVGATVGGYFLFRKDDAPGAVPHGELGNVQLPLGGASR